MDIRDLRQRRGASLRDVASAAGIHFSTLSGIERRRHNASLATLERVLAALDATDDERLAVLAAIGHVPPASKTRNTTPIVRPVGRRNPQARKFAEGAAPGGGRR